MTNLLKIGELASACNTTIKTIRYYEEKNLIKPSKIDEENGYHYYNFDTLISLQKILKLKDLGFSLEEIKNYNDKSNKQKITELQKLLKTTNQKIEKLMGLEYSNIYHLPYFINDEKAIGLWTCFAHAENIEKYKNNEFNSNIDNLTLKHIYFLEHGLGFNTIIDWSKGLINIGTKNCYTYVIENNLLFVNLVEPFTGKHIRTQVYKQVDNKKRVEAPYIYTDNVKIPFVQDNDVLGLWEIFDVCSNSELKNYSPENPKDMSTCFYQSIVFKSNGKCIKEQNANFIYNSYSKNKIIDKSRKTVENYNIINYKNDKFLIINHKSDNYSYNNSTHWNYVFKKV